MYAPKQNTATQYGSWSKSIRAREEKGSHSQPGFFPHPNPLVQSIHQQPIDSRHSPASIGSDAMQVQRAPTSRRGQLLLQLQRQHGNTYVEQVVRLSRQENLGSLDSQPFTNPSVHARQQAGVIQSQSTTQPRQHVSNKGQPASQIMRQPAARPAIQQGTVRDAIDYLQAMTRFIEAQRGFVATVLQAGTTQQQDTQRRRAHSALNQQRIQAYLQQSSSVYEAQLSLLPTNDPLRVRLREVYVQVLDEIRRAASTALDISAGMDAATQTIERKLYAENLARWIEASPMTSTGLVGTTAFQQADITAGRNYEAALEAYLDDLLRNLPMLNLSQAQKDQIYDRILIALRRAFVTVAAGPSGAIDLRAITNAQIVEKYRQVMVFLVSGIANPQQISLITDRIPAYQLPNPVPGATQVNPQLGARKVDLSRVPPDEVDAVRYGIAQVVNVVPSPGSTVQLRNAIWPAALQVRRGGNIVQVRYELVFDRAGNVRAERLGEARPREVDPAFSQLTVPEKKARLVQDFGLAAIDDRPAHGARAAAIWTGPELDQIKAAYDLIPPNDRSALRGYTLVRDHQGPAMAQGRFLMGFAHTAADPAHDDPGPPPHAPPHIHYYDDAFTQNNFTFVGAPGATGPASDWTALHEVGHAQIFEASLAANAAVRAANQQQNQALRALRAAIRGVRLSAAQSQAWNAWNQAQGAANGAIVLFNQGLVVDPPIPQAQQAQRLQAAQAAVQARNAARAGLAAAGLPAAVVRAAANLDAANDALLAASQQIVAARDQIPIFVALANRFGFFAFTDYARTGQDEWFAETYALFLTDPNRLSQMNRNMFLWFQAGMPMDRNWNP